MSLLTVFFESLIFQFNNISFCSHAKSEIDVALDVINMLLSQRKTSSAKDLVLPPNTLQATYVSRPKPTAKHEAEASKLALGSKRKVSYYGKSNERVYLFIMTHPVLFTAIE